MADLYKVATGSVTAPGAGAAICTLTSGSLPAGKYRIRTYAGVSGVAVADLGNMRLRRGGVDLVSNIPCAASGGMEEFEDDMVDLDGTQNLTIEAVGAATAGVEYNAVLMAARVG